MTNPLPLNDNEKERANQALKLAAKIHPRIDRFLDQDKERLFDLVDANGSPLNLVFPQNIEDNVAAFKGVYARNFLQGKIYFTSKPNKSEAIMRQAAMADVNIDVSSEEALKIALGCGFSPDRIEVTGPKNQDYLILALQQGVTVNADNFEELRDILELRRALSIKNKTRLFVRLAGFYSERIKFTSQDGTFGIHVDEGAQAIEFLKTHEAEFDFRGFSYYWSGASHEQRVVAFENALSLTLQAMEAGLSPKGINIGGGFHVQYANDRDEWNSFVDGIKQSLLDYDGESLTWNDNGLGFRNEGGLIKGAPSFMDHAMPKTSADDLEAFLQSPLPAFENMSAARLLAEFMLELYIEPGRSMLDQLGVTVGRVNFTKKSNHGHQLVALDMNRSNMHSTHQKLLTDPIIIHRDEEACAPCEAGLYYYGNLCVSYDMITYHKSFPARIPQKGDLVIFVNTAPYIMDFIESRTLHQNTASKIAVIEAEENRFKTLQDTRFKPLIHLKNHYLK